ncbi:unnamed protein product [Peniophora sp. CBMAI 1063]|nr:unnamed protein product [Peniophora sp. CBMAI 1063]
MASESDRRRLDVDWNVGHLYPYVPRPPLERRPRDSDAVATVHPDYDTYSRFIAHLPTYLTGAPAHTTMSESLFLEHDPDREVSFSRGPYGYFVTFGQRNAWPSTDPGPSPFETEAPTATAPSEVFLGDDQGLWPGAAWYDPSRPESLMRICPAPDLTPAWLDPGWEGWDRVHDLDALNLDPAVRAAVADGIRRDVELARFGAWTEYYLVRGGAHGEGSRRFWTTVREGRRDWSGISIARISEREVRRRHLHDRMLVLRNFPYARALTFLAWTDRNRTEEWARDQFGSDVESDEDEDDISDLPVMTPVHLDLHHPVAPRHPVGQALQRHYERLHWPAPAPPSPPATEAGGPVDHSSVGSPIVPEEDTPTSTDLHPDPVAPVPVPGPSGGSGRALVRRASTESMVSLGDEDDQDDFMATDDVPLSAADAADSRKRRRSSSPPSPRPAPDPPSRATSTPPPSPSKGKGKARATESEEEREWERGARAQKRANVSTKRRRERRKKLEALYLSRQPRAQAVPDDAPGPSTRRQVPTVPNDLGDGSEDEEEQEHDRAESAATPSSTEPELLARMRLTIRGAAAREASTPALALRMDGAPVALLPGERASSSDSARVPPPIYSPSRRPMARTPGWTAAPSRWSLSPLPLVPTDWRAEVAALSPRVVDSVPGVSWPAVVLPSVETSVALDGIIVLSEHGALRYRRWLLTHAEGATDEFVRWMVQRGVRWDHGARGHLSAPSPSASFAGAPDAPPAWSEWLIQVEDLLNMPRARQFIRDGGIAWRIALQFGPPHLAASVLAGPSTEARSPLPGEQWHGADVVVDRPTTEDYELLIGRAGGRSWWPHPDEWDANVGPGEWTLGLERWFQARLRGSDISEGQDTGSLRLPVADGAWRAHLSHALHARQRHLLSRGEGRVLPHLLALADVTDAMRRLDLG